jgi:hypothetical protein
MVKNIKSKRSLKKISQSTNMCYFAVCLWKLFSLQPTLTPSQWLKNGPFAMIFLSQDELHVNDECARIQAQKNNSQSTNVYILHLPLSLLVT